MMQQGNFDAIHISGQGLRDGLFYEHFLRHQETPLFENVREFSIHNLARLYNYEPTHVAKVRELSLSLFDKLQPLHSYGAWERELLGYAALLHDIGIQVGYYDHHKHSAYLLANTTLPGFSHREIAILTVLVRSHRKGDVKTGEYSAVLHEDDTERLARLGGILRMAEDLERSKSQVVRDVDIEFEDDTIRLRLLSNQDTTIEIWNANRRNSLLQKAFGRTVDIVGESNGD
jgi:exopolyphosphatase/guanosine-5'-triphosphate,3'-diphosphate pyrophosphatase